MEEVRGKTSAKQMIMRRKRGRLCLKEIWQTGEKRSVGPSWGLSSLVWFYLPPPPASSGTARIIPASLSLLSGLSGSLINQQAALFTSVALRAQLCRCVTWLAGLLIPGVGYNSSLPPSFPHYCSLPLTFLLSLLHHLFLSCNLIVFLVLDLICWSICIRYLVFSFIKLIIFAWKFCPYELPSAIYNKAANNDCCHCQFICLEQWFHLNGSQSR